MPGRTSGGEKIAIDNQRIEVASCRSHLSHKNKGVLSSQQALLCRYLAADRQPLVVNELLLQDLLILRPVPPCVYKKWRTL